MKIAVLGAGMVGRAMALDLAAHPHEVCSFDIDPTNLQWLTSRDSRIKTRQADLKQFDQYTEWLSPFDAVVTAVPGFMGYETLKAVIQAGKNCADISFFPENVLELDELARKQAVTVITDVGVAPGMSNLILGRYNEWMKVTSFECYVGGLPLHPRPPFFYKAPFSPVDVMEEYTRPARLMEKGEVIEKPALTDRALMEFEGVGKLEAFNTDGLRSLLYTMSHIPDMKEQTLRYPGHLDLIISLQQAGFFDKEELEIKGVRLSPYAFSTKHLIREWKLGEEEEELTVMRVIVSGETDGEKTRVEYNLLDTYDRETKTSSMSRTTGYTCTAALSLISEGLFTQKGVFPPEKVGSDKACFEFMLDYLEKRGVHWKKK